jgi:beta-lactamase regulating signal transducer with metallopeptidase domain
MATFIAEQSLMASNLPKAKILSIATRFATWVLPSNRKEWAAAMLNEVEYVESQHMLRWIAGSVLSAVKARVSYEMERTFMSRGILKTFLALCAVMVVAIGGVYAMQKPYQRERIKLVILQHVEGSSTQPARSGR